MSQQHDGASIGRRRSDRTHIVLQFPPAGGAAVSIEAINWALNHAPILTGRKDASALAITLIARANHAGPDGTEAFPPAERLTTYTRLSCRTVQRAPLPGRAGPDPKGNPCYRDARIERADHRPRSTTWS
ncbi:hypothetical protein GCM10009660_23310 [Catellatospora bangladeshensis]